jgi:hypothetical protein
MAIAYQRKPNLAHSVIDKFLILVHPCAWEAVGTPLSDPLRAREEEVRKRWASKISSLQPTTFVIQVDYSQNHTANELHQWFIDRLGQGRVARIPVRVVGASTPGPLMEYYEDIRLQVTQQIATEGLTFDPASVQTEIWGESFEGCAPGLGSGIAYYLGLQTLTRLDYNLAVPDALFILAGTFIQTVQIPESDVEAYVFDLNDGRVAALFRSCLTPQWVDYRPIELQLDSDFSVITKQGDIVWQGQGTEDKNFVLTTVQAQFLIAPVEQIDKLTAVVKSAKVGTPTIEMEHLPRNQLRKGSYDR